MRSLQDTVPNISIHRRAPSPCPATSKKNIYIGDINIPIILEKVALNNAEGILPLLDVVITTHILIVVGKQPNIIIPSIKLLSIKLNMVEKTIVSKGW